MQRTMAHCGEISYILEQQIVRALQDYLVERGQLFPGEFDRSDVWQMLDVACGTGQWVRDVARTYPDIEVVGLDIQTEAIEYAQMLAQTSHVENAVFVPGNMFAMREIADNSFDVVHARFLAMSVQTHLWPVALEELVRVCRPDGKIIWTEAALPTMNSLACRQWCELMEEAIMRRGYTANVTGFMERLLKDTGCCGVRKSEMCIDIGAASSFNQRIYRYLVALVSLLEPWLSSAFPDREEQITRLCRDAIIDVFGEAFRGEWVVVTVMCQKGGMGRADAINRPLHDSRIV